ncbi:MAG: aminoglycoside phosphotransferase family protein [bacterium]
MQHDATAAASTFNLPGPIRTVAPHPVGHINDSFIVTCDARRFLLQRINHDVFKNPAAVMENIARVTAHLRSKNVPTLSLVPTRDGRPYLTDNAGGTWRMYDYIAGAQSFDLADSPARAREAARAFGGFQCALADLPPPRLKETIPDFHNTPQRFAAFRQAVASDRANRAVAAKREIEFALSHESLERALIDLHLPERVTHNDTKINNVLFDERTGRAVCVIDLDTVMPGLALYDFGDLVRTATSPAAEDERDLSRVVFQRSMYDALVEGYLEAVGDMVVEAEKENLALAGRVITFETGLRFLTDHLNGDAYFKVHREGHNLDRCRMQFRLVECMP